MKNIDLSLLNRCMPSCRTGLSSVNCPAIGRLDFQSYVIGQSELVSLVHTVVQGQLGSSDS